MKWGSLGGVLFCEKRTLFLYMSESTCKDFAFFFTCHARVFLVQSRRVRFLLCLLVVRENG